MKITPVAIKITDLRKFAEVAFLVDRDDFLQDLIKLRKKWGLDKQLLLLPPTKPWFTFPWQVKDSQLESYIKATVKLETADANSNKMGKMSIKDKNKYLRNLKKTERLLPSNDFRSGIMDLRKKYRRPPNFDRIIAHSVIYGEVTNQDFISCEAKIIYPEQEFPQYFQDTKLVIELYPPVKTEEIEKIIKNVLPAQVKKYEKHFIRGNIEDYDTRPTIVRNRGWYWFKKNHSWSQVYKKAEIDIGGNIASSSVRDAIDEYKKRLI
ncbi:MAG: hypothetical protein UV73_C0011G0042 [Candidatus Gottesmanbacteria bacterium GW2011_GWA2_43_14]|uniref:Uncharacterized protein n=1 Tax=Candidatus Gottesmanbacteria bacterium GW2011_GWA2_43_14 TaxID=1618443 RepID=A0A0G1DEP0_9BACT|nr:MAG: hypothetical protein UV73_C0011G0042 [Candidatus Gottesmanbacteria bacterium GW2011_GWA2_43_14]